MISIFIFQMVLCFGVWKTRVSVSSSLPPTIAFAITRMFAGLFMQIHMSRELKEGMDKMKYVLNHTWKFDNLTQAWLAGFFQCIIIMLVTLLNYFTIIAAETVIDIVMNFLALAVIAELDDYFFIAHGKSELGKRMVMNEDEEFTDLFKIETTTSRDAR